MNAGTPAAGHGGAMGFGQFMADQRPRFDNVRRKKIHRENQVMSRSGIIRPSKRKKSEVFMILQKGTKLTVLRAVMHGEPFEGEELMNKLGNKFWARVGDTDRVILVCFDEADCSGDYSHAREGSIITVP